MRPRTQWYFCPIAENICLSSVAPLQTPQSASPPVIFLEIDKEFLPASIAGVEMCCSSVCNLFNWTRQLTIQLSGGGGAGQLC